jgi:hypothetical protein
MWRLVRAVNTIQILNRFDIRFSKVVAVAIDKRRPLYFMTAVQSYDVPLGTFPRVPPPRTRNRQQRVHGNSVAGVVCVQRVNLNAVASSATGTNLHLAQLSLKNDCEGEE